MIAPWASKTSLSLGGSGPFAGRAVKTQNLEETKPPLSFNDPSTPWTVWII